MTHGTLHRFVGGSLDGRWVEVSSPPPARYACYAVDPCSPLVANATFAAEVYDRQRFLPPGGGELFAYVLAGLPVVEAAWRLFAAGSQAPPPEERV